MKKIIAIALVLVLALSLVACGAKGATLADVKKAGKITVATSPDFPPFESLENNEVVGIEVEIMKLIAKDLGVEIEFVQMDFDSVLAGIQSAKYDCAMSGITVTPKREKNMLFTDPYYNAAQVIVVKADSAVKGKADLKDKTVSVQTGTTAESGCQDEGIAVQAFAANADAKAALTTGKVDAWVVDNLTAMQMVTEADGLVVLEEKMTEEPYAFAFAKGSEDLVAEINKSLTKLVNDGTVEKIFSDFGEAYAKP
ncbi:MAG: transporter substrate-binding domain-containing protein [Ruminococcaceae bacterium]|nr:transporter substrate-binding domain-containing protein [Oscillospiraceae bacterium]